MHMDPGKITAPLPCVPAPYQASANPGHIDHAPLGVVPIFASAFFRDGDGARDGARAAGSSDCGTFETSRPLSQDTLLPLSRCFLAVRC